MAHVVQVFRFFKQNSEQTVSRDYFTHYISLWLILISQTSFIFAQYFSLLQWKTRADCPNTFKHVGLLDITFHICLHVVQLWCFPEDEVSMSFSWMSSRSSEMLFLHLVKITGRDRPNKHASATECTNSIVVTCFFRSQAVFILI